MRQNGNGIGQPTGVDIGQAARHLGTTTTALRKRLQRGHIRGYKRDGRWFVVLPMGRDSGASLGRDMSQDMDEPSGQDMGSPIVDALRDEIADLRRRLDRAEQERERLEQLVNQAQQLAASRFLPTPTEQPQQQPSPEPARRSWLARFLWGPV